MPVQAADTNLVPKGYVAPTTGNFSDVTPIPDNIWTLFNRFQNPNVASYAGVSDLVDWTNAHPYSALAIKYRSETDGSQYVAPDNPFSLPSLGQVGDSITKSFSDPKTALTSIMAPGSSPFIQSLFGSNAANTLTGGASGEIANLNFVQSKYETGDGADVTTAQQQSAIRGLAKVGVTIASAGAADYFASAETSAGVGTDAELESGYTVAEDTQTGSALVDEGGYTYAADPANAAIDSNELVQVDAADSPLYEMPADNVAAETVSAPDGTGWGYKDYLGVSTVGVSTALALKKGDIAGAAGALGAPGSITDLLPSGPGSTLFPNNYQGLSQPQANSSAPLNLGSMSTNSKAIVYLGLGLGLLFLLKKVRHG